MSVVRFVSRQRGSEEFLVKLLLHFFREIIALARGHVGVEDVAPPDGLPVLSAVLDALVHVVLLAIEQPCTAHIWRREELVITLVWLV